MPEIFNVMFSLGYKMNIVHTLLQDIKLYAGKLFRGLTQNNIIVVTYKIPFYKYEILHTIFFLFHHKNIIYSYIIIVWSVYIKDIKKYSISSFYSIFPMLFGLTGIALYLFCFIWSTLNSSLLKLPFLRLFTINDKLSSKHG